MQKNDPSQMTGPSSLCPNCRFPVSAEDTFCGECGFDLTQQSAEIFLQVPADEGPEGAEIGALKARVGRFVAPRNLRRSYFDLGLALKAQARYREASQAFGQARQAQGSTPREVDILLQQAFAYEQDSNLERAFRAYLEAVSKEPEEADIVLPYIHRMVTPKIVLENGVWLVSEWAQSFEKMRISPVDRVQIAAFLGRIHLFLGQYEAAIKAFQRALMADESSAQTLIKNLLGAAYLPPEFDLQANHGQAQFALARIWQVLGNSEEALRIVELALSMDLGDENYPEAPVQQFKADLLANLGQNSAAAQWYYEAGRRYTWRDESKTAARLLERAVSLKKNYPEACWSWMDAERILAYDEKPPFVNRQALERSLTAWRTGLYSGWPDKTFSWAYLTRALVCELEARLDPSRRLNHWWNAIRWLEAALVLDPSDADSWAYLGRFFRYMDLESNGDVVTRRALELDQDNLAALEERSAVLANRGRFEEAGPINDRRRELAANTWADAVGAYILIGQANAAAAQVLYTGQSLPESPPWLSNFEEALRVLEPLVSVEEEDTWYLEMYASCLYSLPGREEEAMRAMEKVYQACLAPKVADSVDVRFSRAWMAFLTGRVEEAIGLYQDILGDRVLGSSARRNLGICLFSQGKWTEGADALRRGIAEAQNIRECDETINDMQEVPHIPEELYADLRTMIVERRKSLAQYPTAAEEMQTAINELPPGRPGHKARCAGRAVLARLYMEDHSFGEAIAAYRQFKEDEFPVAQQAVNQVVNTWQETIDVLLKDKRMMDARQELEQMESFIPEADQPQRLAELDVRLALAAFSDSQAGPGREYFERALSRGYEAQWVAAGEQIGEIWRDLLVDPAQLWGVDGQLSSLAADPTLAEEAAAARRSLQPFLDTYFHLDREITADDEPYCLPIVLWVGAQLVPLIDPAVDRKFIYQDIPDLRQRIQDAMGIVIPGVRVRDDQNSTTTFQIDLFEHKVAQGLVYLEMSFCNAAPWDLDELQVPKENYIPVIDTLFGHSGCWVDAAYTRVVAGANWRVSSPSEYMLAHLERVLRWRLADLVSVTAVERLLDHLDAHWNDLMDRSLPNMAAHLGFARLLRALVREHVPVTRLPEILQAGANGGLDDPTRFAEMLRAARLKLGEQLPGNQGEKVLPVPSEWEQRMEGWWTERNGLPVVEPPAGELNALLAAVGEWTADLDQPGVLLVQSPRLRPYLRRWIEDRFPHWPVLSREESRRTQAKA